MKLPNFALFVTVLLAFFAGTASAQKLDKHVSINIRISGIPLEDATNISGEYTINGEGYLTQLAYLENMKIKASGLTPSSLAQKIRSAYKDAQIFTRPSVAISFSK
ncbi:MAG: hypothetical protein AAF514_10050, partial [Verrucomicrobiota bacterium]